MLLRCSSDSSGLRSETCLLHLACLISHAGRGKRYQGMGKKKGHRHWTPQTSLWKDMEPHLGPHEQVRLSVTQTRRRLGMRALPCCCRLIRTPSRGRKLVYRLASLVPVAGEGRLLGPCITALWRSLAMRGLRPVPDRLPLRLAVPPGWSQAPNFTYYPR